MQQSVAPWTRWHPQSRCACMRRGGRASRPACTRGLPVGSLDRTGVDRKPACICCTTGKGARRLTLWHATPQNQAALQREQRSSPEVAPQFSAWNTSSCMRMLCERGALCVYINLHAACLGVPERMGSSSRGPAGRELQRVPLTTGGHALQDVPLLPGSSHLLSAVCVLCDCVVRMEAGVRMRCAVARGTVQGCCSDDNRCAQCAS